MTYPIITHGASIRTATCIIRIGFITEFTLAIVTKVTGKCILSYKSEGTVMECEIKSNTKLDPRKMIQKSNAGGVQPLLTVVTAIVPAK